VDVVAILAEDGFDLVRVRERIGGRALVERVRAHEDGFVLVGGVTHLTVFLVRLELAAPFFCEHYRPICIGGAAIDSNHCSQHGSWRVSAACSYVIIFGLIEIAFPTPALSFVGHCSLLFAEGNGEHPREHEGHEKNEA
jgi:hypothetical protein